MSETSADQQGDVHDAASPKQPRTAKFRRRQEAIVRAAVSLINKKGVRGMTLVEVASQLGIVPTGVIYYFPNKERLAATCFLELIAVYEDLIAHASAGETPRDRLGRFVRGYVALAHDVASGRRDPLAVFNDVRALDDPTVNAAYTDMFRHARSLIDPTPPRNAERQALNAATHMVLSQLFWSVVWLPLYDREDYDGIAARMLDVLDRGLAADSAQWPAGEPAAAEPPAASEDVSRETFLRAATQIINEHGYLGASVDKIVAPERHQGLVLSSQRGEGRPGGRLLSQDAGCHAALAAGHDGGSEQRLPPRRGGRDVPGPLPGLRADPAAAHLRPDFGARGHAERAHR